MSRTRIVLVGVAVLLTAVFASFSQADTVTYTILDPLSLPGDCTFDDGPGSYTVIATLDLSAPAKFLKVSSMQSCGGSGISWSYPVYGDPASVLTVDFGGCISGSVTLFTAQFDVLDCCPSLLAGPITIGPGQDSPPVLIGCDDEPRFVIPPCSANPPTLVSPADGAMAALSPTLYWNYAYGDYCSEGIGLAVFKIFYGTDPANLDQELGTLENRGTLTDLTASTHYFWRIRVWDEFAQYSGTHINHSTIWSFTTEGPIAVRLVTWGAVKALFR